MESEPGFQAFDLSCFFARAGITSLESTPGGITTVPISLFYRYAVLAGSVIVAIGSIAFLPLWIWLWPFTLVATILSLIGLHDLCQKQHAILRNYPILGHIRYLVEDIRPEIRQYLLESDDDKLPFSRSQRSLIYARAKNEDGDRPFGTLMDVYASGYEFISHSIRPAPVGKPEAFRIEIGGPQCTQPYSASVLNISAMSFGSLSANAIRALNRGAHMGNFAHDTGEGSISPYHREHGGDLIWELGSGYFGCRTDDGRFDPERFSTQAREPQVKMIEIKLSQGAKPGHGGILPAHKVSREIALTRGVPEGKECVSPARHSAFDTPIEMMQFIARLRELSGGKPVGFKLCLGHPWEFMGIVKAMLATNIAPDFIVVDGAEGGTGAAPVEFTDHLGVPLREGLLFVHNTLVGANLRSRIRLGASGKVVSAFDIASLLAIGADWINSARGFMFAIGCIQSLNCHTNRCPTGVATQDASRQRALVVPDKAERVHHFHRNTLKALAELLAAAGVRHPSELGPHHLVRRTSQTEIRLFSQLHRFLTAGSLLEESVDSDIYTASWKLANAESFDLIAA
jgi:glutamate synthase domain-containing protein 2